MKNIILSLVLSLVLLGCDSALRSDGGKSSSDSNRNGQAVGEVCYSNSRFCLPQLNINGINDPQNDYKYLENDRGPQYRRPSFLIDLRNQNLQKNISENFAAIEYVSAVKGPFAILSRALVNAMQSIRDDIRRPVTINSGYR